MLSPPPGSLMIFVSFVDANNLGRVYLVCWSCVNAGLFSGLFFFFCFFFFFVLFFFVFFGSSQQLIGFPTSVFDRRRGQVQSDQCVAGRHNHVDQVGCGCGCLSVCVDVSVSVFPVCAAAFEGKVRLPINPDPTLPHNPSRAARRAWRFSKCKTVGATSLG